MAPLDRKKYVFSEAGYFPVPLDRLISSKPRPFPLFIYFKQNEHLMLRFSEGQEVAEAQLALYFRNGMSEFWCPNEFLEEWRRYCELAPEVDAPSPDLIVVETTEVRDTGEKGHASRNPEAEKSGESPVEDPTEPEALLSEEARSEAAADAIEILLAPEFTQQEKREELERVGMAVLSVLADLDGSDQKQTQEALVHCRDFADDVVRIAASSHAMSSVYEDLEMIRAAAPFHSGVVSAFSVIFAMGLGHSDPDVLADLSLAAMLHDVGTLRDPNESVAVAAHVSKTIDVLSTHRVRLTDAVRMLIEQHHERYDGTGYPRKLLGYQLGELPQIIGISDDLDELMSGHNGARPLSPLEGLLEIRERKKFQPELIESIYQLVHASRNEAAQAPSRKVAPGG